MKVIKSSCHLFVEKPLVFKMQEAKKLLAEAKKRKLFFGINFNWRYSTPVRKAVQAINENKLGEINFITWRFGGSGGGGDPHGNLIETQCHGFDMLEYLNGPIKSVQSIMTDKTNNGFSTFVVSMKFKNKSVGSLVGSYDTSYAYPNTHYLEINGSKGRILIEDQVRKYSFNKKDNETAVSTQKREQREDSHASITGRPNIDEISKRNEEAERREKKSFYTVTGIIVLFIVVVVVLIYFFS